MRGPGAAETLQVLAQPGGTPLKGAPGQREGTFSPALGDHEVTWSGSGA